MFQFDSFAEFIAMGGHGAYVWSAYLISLVLLISLVVIPLRRKRLLLKQVERQCRREQAAQTQKGNQSEEMSGASSS